MFRKARSIVRWADFTQLISHNILNGIAAAIVYIWHSWFKCTTETSIQHIISKILNKSMLFRDLLCTLTITVFALLFAFEFTKRADSFVIQLSLSNSNYHYYSSHVSHIFYFFVIFCHLFYFLQTILPFWYWFSCTIDPWLQRWPLIFLFEVGTKPLYCYFSFERKRNMLAVWLI